MRQYERGCEARDMQEHDEVKRPWWNPKCSTVALVALFMVCTCLIPESWLLHVREIFASRTPDIRGTFSTRAAKLDDALHQGDVIEDLVELERLRVELQMRRVLSTGPFAGEHLPMLKAMLLGFNAQVVMEHQDGGRETMRREQARRIVRKFHRLDQNKVAAALINFDMQYKKALRIHTS